MERDLSQGFRASLTQLFTRLTGAQQTERQEDVRQAERQTVDGVVRGQEDPDRQRPLTYGLGQTEPVLRDEIRSRTATDVDEVSILRQTLERIREEPTMSQASDRLSDQLAALQKRLEAQQTRQAPGREHGHGMER